MGNNNSLLKTLPYLLKTLPYEVIIYILSYIEIEIKDEMRIKDLYGYFEKDNNIWIYELWSNICITNKMVKKIPYIKKCTSLSLGAIT